MSEPGPISYSQRRSAAAIDFEGQARCNGMDQTPPHESRIRCGICGRQSAAPHSIYAPYDDNSWQDEQIKWQEACDVIMVKHMFEGHNPQQCNCSNELPEKPVRNYERL